MCHPRADWSGTTCKEIYSNHWTLAPFFKQNFGRKLWNQKSDKQLPTKEKQIKCFSFAPKAFTPQDSRFECTFGKIRTAGLVWVKWFPSKTWFFSQRRTCKPLTDVCCLLKTLMYGIWPSSPSFLCILVSHASKKRGLFKICWNELKDSLNFQWIWIRVNCKSTARRPCTSTQSVCSQQLKNVWNHKRGRCTAGSAAKKKKSRLDNPDISRTIKIKRGKPQLIGNHKA